MIKNKFKLSNKLGLCEPVFPASIYSGYVLFQCNLSKTSSDSNKDELALYEYQNSIIIYNDWPLLGSKFRQNINLINCDKCSSLNTRAKVILDTTRPLRLNLLLDMVPVSYETQVKNAWNIEDKSPNILVKVEDPTTFYRFSAYQSSDCIRGRVGYTKGLHLWKLIWPLNQRERYATVGVATSKALLHTYGYQSLVGGDNESWGWDLVSYQLYHDLKNSFGIPYPALLSNFDEFSIPESFYVILDMDCGTLSFMANGQYLGIAFRGLQNKKLYPIVGCVWGLCEVTLKYIGGYYPDPSPLKDICRQVIRGRVGKKRLFKFITQLNLPKPLINYLLFHDLFSESQ